MKKYIITAREEKDYTAASKAREDAEAIARKAGYVPFPFRGERSARESRLSALKLIGTTLGNWRRLMKEAEPGSLVLIQYPHFPLKTARLIRWAIPTIRKIRKIHFVFLVHDLNSIRGFYGKTAVYSDRYVLKEADTIICHNGKMREYLVRQGIPAEKLISLEIFDYLTDAPMTEHQLRDGVAIAGNLNPQKCGYIGKIDQVGSESLPIHLYGNGYPQENQTAYVVCHGAFPAEELPGKIRGGFGLVWDGAEIMSCQGKTGDYLRVNNPHKLSLYLASGLPVILWNEAAEAGFVEENRVGILTSRLTDLEEQIRNLSADDYRAMTERARETGIRLREGSYLASALEKAEQRAKEGSKC